MWRTGIGFSGARADNLEKAIEALEAALLVRTPSTSPREWAQTENNLANAYEDRIRGARAENLEKAIAAYQAALSVRTKEDFPEDWAQTQNNLGVAFRNRILGARSDNIEKSIAAYEAALTVRTKELVPRAWALTQNNLAIAYKDRVRGDRASNLESAVSAAEAALTVFTRESGPEDWARVQNSLAIVYSDRLRGNPSANIERAISAAQSAFSVFTREAFPQDWAENQYVLGNAYRTRASGAHAENLRSGIAAFEAALSIFTPEAFPRFHLRAARRLGELRMELGEWEEASTVFATAREAFLLLFGQGLEEADAEDLIGEAGPLFGEAAFVAAERGENLSAAIIANEGRARLLAVALKLQTIELSAREQQRLEELRAAIRTQARAVEATQGRERMASLDTLVGLRSELLKLVTSAEGGKTQPASTLAGLRSAVPKGGAILLPVLTKNGSKILIVLEREGQLSIRVASLPELTVGALDRFLRGEDGKTGWLGAYNINYLPSILKWRRWGEWISAIDDIGATLWRFGGDRLDAALRENGISSGARLVWMPTGALGILPIGIAQDPVSKRRFVDQYEIVYGSSFEALAAAERVIGQQKAPSLAAIINPTADLPATEKEGTIVGSYFADNARTLIRGSAATTQSVLAALKGRTHWHFASHGDFSWDDARQSGIILHNEARLTVASLLQADALGRPRLVVLSACETGLYDIRNNPDEFTGLPGAFTSLGAAGVLSTLWPVSDEATALLIARFYELHMREGQSPATALVHAQAWLREATKDDLTQYAQAATSQGRMTSRHLAEVKSTLDSPNRGFADLLLGDKPLPTEQTQATSLSPASKPYAHPYFWAGFIYTGL